jgi:hypothetical protein
MVGDLTNILAFDLTDARFSLAKQELIEAVLSMEPFSAGPLGVICAVLQKVQKDYVAEGAQ